MATVAVAAIVIASDQATTSWALADLRRPEHLLGPLGLALQFNSGTAFSLFSGSGAWIVAVVVVLLVVVTWLAWFSRRPWVGVAYGLVLGGAIGNLADRLFRGHHGDVVDFIALSHWPTFNLADAAITAGVVALIVTIIFRPAGEFDRPPGRDRVAARPASAVTRPLDTGPTTNDLEEVPAGDAFQPGATERLR